MRTDSRSFYVKRISPSGRVGWTGSLRPRYRADREAQAWRDSGWTAEVLPSTLLVRAEVREWVRQGREDRAAA